MHWSQQQGTMAQQLLASPAATQVAEASNTVPQGQALLQSRMVGASQAQLSQVDRQTSTRFHQGQDGNSRERGPWQQLALDVVALCKPMSAATVIQAIKALSNTSGGKEELLEHGPQHVAALVLGRSLPGCPSMPRSRLI
jgi:hypothetical protein